jgi:hypothetical protein
LPQLVDLAQYLTKSINNTESDIIPAVLLQDPLVIQNEAVENAILQLKASQLKKSEDQIPTFLKALSNSRTQHISHMFFRSMIDKHPKAQERVEEFLIYLNNNK